MDNAWDSIHRDFEGNGHLLLDLFRRNARPLRDHLDVVVGHVRVCLDPKGVERNRSPGKQEQPYSQDEKTIVKGEIDCVAEHARRRTVSACPLSPLIAKDLPGNGSQCLDWEASIF